MLFDLISTIMSYVFITVIYTFIFAIIRMIYKDIAATVKKEGFEEIQSNPVLRVIGYKNRPYTGQANEYPLEKTRIVVGRDKSCDISIDDILISKRHTLLWSEGDEWHIRDLRSKNGTILNNEIIKESYILDDGDSIKIGDLVLEFRL